MKINDKSGFTLIEVLAVAAILATIAVVSIAGYVNTVPRVTVATAEILEGKLNSAANEWVNLKIEAGQVGTSLADLGNTLEEAVASLKTPIEIDGITVRTGVPKNVNTKKVEKFGISYTGGEFTLNKK